MSKTVSSTLRDRVLRTSAPEYPVVLVEIYHAQLAGDHTVRVCNDTNDFVHNGHTYAGIPFRLTWPDDQDQQAPRAKLSIDNVGKELMAWIDISQGGRGAQVTLKQVLPSSPNLVELEVTLALLSVNVSTFEVSAELGFDNIFGAPLVRMFYRPDSHPGVF